MRCSIAPGEFKCKYLVTICDQILEAAICDLKIATSSDVINVLLLRNPSTEIKICRHCLTHLQSGADTPKDDGVHAKSHRAFYTGILPIALQGIPDFAADCSSLRINIGDGTARTGLDRIQQNFFSACLDVHYAQPVFIVRRRPDSTMLGLKRSMPTLAWPAAATRSFSSASDATLSTSNGYPSLSRLMANDGRSCGIYPRLPANYSRSRRTFCSLLAAGLSINASFFSYSRSVKASVLPVPG